ncbi:MAG: hypothetical protein AOA65_0870 [Candidatus Bathyarchaeota archaeon BA1]|nr:MAG: hypothetical protein AOA65_0870 [Candidatus Bathyarchaeota archaeon BA1]
MAAHAPEFDPGKIRVILATDCGSTTSKARFFKKLGNEYRFVASGEAPTTVEAPYEDVTLGVRNAIREVEELTGHKMLDEKGIIMPCQGERVGVDLYVTTSSAGGGLQMMVAGVIKSMTAESAERAALGAGAIVMDVIAIDDGRRGHQKIERIRSLRPDMILVAGGTDGGTVTHVVEIAELISSAEPKPRLGVGFQLPIVYAGNKEARRHVSEVLGGKFAMRIVDNIRPVLEVENPDPSREAVHDLFMEHVMSHAPGYDKLMRWTEVPIMPTPAAEGRMFRTIAETYNANVIGVGLGGATTNVYSIYEGKFVRTVSANLGMSYSVCNVLKEAGIRNIMRWVPFDVSEVDVRNRLRNKMIRPTTIPETLDDLLIEHSVAREALRLAFAHHKFLARPLRGVQRIRDIADIFDQRTFEETYIDMMRVKWLAGTGGLLSHAPRRAQSALMLIDAFQPEGVTKLAQDSVFMMPHLGVLSTVHPKASMEIFEKDCLVRLGTCIAPKGQMKREEERRETVTVKVNLPDGKTLEERLPLGTIKRIPLKEGEKAQVEISPAPGFDVGTGPGHTLTTSIEGGVVGIIIDARGRPLTLPEDGGERRKKLLEWFEALDAYPEKLFEICG